VNQNLLRLPVITQRAGLELPVVLNIEYYVIPKFRLYSSLNILNSSFTLDHIFVANPVLTDRQRSNGGFNLEVNLLTEIMLATC